MASTERSDDDDARRPDVDNRGVLFFALSLAVGILAVAAAVYGLFQFLNERENRADKPLSPLVAAALKRTPPEPRLEPQPLAPRETLRADENRLLTSYGWIDRNAGTVRIPIEAAMDITARRGLPPSLPMSAVPGMAAPTAQAGGK